MLSNVRVVLVRTHFAGNLGSVARAMCNFGLTDLALVEPFADPRAEEARRLATHGEHLLEQARIVGTIDEAVADCAIVLATSGNVEGLYREQHYGRPDEMMARFLPLLAESRCALVFGPEPHGLSNADIARCHGLIRIPTDPACPSLNLAQSVAICLYELRKLWLIEHGRSMSPGHKPARFVDQERMFDSLREALTEVHFLWGQKAESLMHAVRQLIARAQPTPNEVRILFGLARQLKWVARNGVSESSSSASIDDAS